jgi:hypothetical protein
MEHHLNKAKEAAYNINQAEVMSEIRKITALGVAAMEHNTTPSR